jgi:hypothetical protein
MAKDTVKRIKRAHPELDKLQRATEERHTQEIGEFLEWLAADGIVLCRVWEDGILPDRETTEKRLARYVGVDLQKAEKERRQMLEDLRT